MSFAESVMTGTVQALQQIALIWAIMIPLEIVFSRGRKITVRARVRVVVFSAIAWAAISATLVASTLVVQRIGIRPLLAFSPGYRSMPEFLLKPVAGSLIAILLTDFLYYWFHRLQHASPMLWRFHAVHHAIEDLSVASYGHWTEGLWRFPLMTIPFALLMPSGLPVLPIAGAFAVMQSQYIHSPTTLNFGPFWRVVYDNRFHRLHHSVEARHFNKNFGVTTPLWDWMFGTLYVPAKDEWPDTGLVEEREVTTVGDLLWRPFRRARPYENSQISA